MDAEYTWVFVIYFDFFVVFVLDTDSWNSVNVELRIQQ